MSVSVAIGVAGLAIAIIRAMLPYAGVKVPTWAARSALVVALVLLAVALTGLMWPLGAAYRLELVSSADQHSAADMTWPLAVMCAGVAYGTLRAAARVMTWADPEVRILSPLGGAVGHQPRIYGSVWPPGSDVQFFVFSGDGRWHPIRAAVDGALWKLEPGYVGDERTPSGSEFRLAAVSGAGEVRTPLRKLPRGAARSRTVSVTRR